MNRRGLTVPLNFLIGIVIAIIIFFPASVAIAKVLGINREGQKSYAKLVEELQDFSEETSYLLHLDKETMLAYFDEGQSVVDVYVQGTGDLRNPGSQSHHAEVTIQKPADCNGNAACLCLFRKVDVDSTVVQDAPLQEQCALSGCPKVKIEAEATIRGTAVQCNQNLPYELFLPDCGIGQPVNVVEYHCSNGFIIERGVFEKGLGGYLRNPSKILLNLNQEPLHEDTIILEAPQ